jgi:hypothetical protein
MTERARNLFNAYVINSLNHPDMKSVGIGSHVFNLSSAAADARIPSLEMTEEMGPLAEALIAAKKKV